MLGAKITGRLKILEGTDGGVQEQIGKKQKGLIYIETGML